MTVTVCRSPLYSRTNTVPGFSRRFSSFGFLAAGEPIKELDRFPVEATESLLLDPVSDHPGEDILGQTLGRDGAEHHAPTFAQCVDAEGSNLVNLGVDRSGINGPLRHGYAALRSVVGLPVFVFCGFTIR